MADAAQTTADPSVEARFETLASTWRAETRVMSSVEDMSTHFAYQQIIGMGPGVVPLILRELEREPEHWFWALRAITGQNPVRPESRGRLDAMTSAWLAWGREQGLVD